MTENLELVEGRVSAAATAGSGDVAGLAADLGRLPEQDARSILTRVAAEQGSATVPLLEALATQTAGAAAAMAVDALGTVRDPAAASALRRLSQAMKDGGLRKSARRALHRLSTLGVGTDTIEPSAAQTKVELRPVYRCVASPVDGLGNRLVWFGFDRGSEVDLLVFLLCDEVGIKDSYVRDMARSRFDRTAEKLLKDEEMPWVEMPADYCRRLVEEAHAVNATTGTRLPLPYLAWRERLGSPIQTYDQPLVYSVINPAEVRWDPSYLDSSDKLYDLPMFQPWLFEDPKVLLESTRQWETVRESRIVLAGASREAREHMVVDRAIQRLFDAPYRRLLKRRLEEMAYHLWKLGRPRQARLALAAALAMEPADRSLLNHPFVRKMVEWTLTEAVEAKRGERTKAVKPGVHLYLP